MAAPAISAVPPDDKAALDAILNKLEAERKRPCIVYWTSQMARMSIAVENSLVDQLGRLGGKTVLDLVLHTNGGDTEAPWRVISLIREYVKDLAVLIPHRALSSGTLTALGANEIVMTPFAVLGPIDPSRGHPLLPVREGAKEPEPVSVQDMRHAMQFIVDSTAQTGAGYSPEAMAQIFSALFDKIHPLAIGAIEQSYALSKLIATRCLGTHMDATKESGQIEGLVNKLCDSFKSHSYQIGRTEAKACGLKVAHASDTEQTLLYDILKFYMGRPVGPFGPNMNPNTNVQTVIAWLDSPRFKSRVVQQHVVQKDHSLANVGDQWTSY